MQWPILLCVRFLNYLDYNLATLQWDVLKFRISASSVLARAKRVRWYTATREKVEYERKRLIGKDQFYSRMYLTIHRFLMNVNRDYVSLDG